MESLEEALAQVHDFLQRYQVRGWPESLRHCQEEIQRLRTQQDWQHFLRNLHLFGGMGSLDDLIICRQNGPQVDDEVQVNAQLSRLVAELYNTVTKYRARYDA